MDINNVMLVGRITKELELKQVGEKNLLKFSIACNRMKKDEADFINCVAWEKTAEIISKFCSKGSKVGIVGRIQTGSYDDKEGKKVYTTDIVVQQVQFLDSKKKDGANDNTENTDNVSDDEFPF
jgi:single-strand DNA-binding protein